MRASDSESTPNGSSGRRVWGVVLATVAICLAIGCFLVLQRESGQHARTARKPASEALESSEGGSQPNKGLTAEEEQKNFTNQWLASRTGTLLGQVLSKGSGEPLGHPIDVQLEGETPQGIRLKHATTTDAAGYFKFEEIKYPLTYHVACFADALGIDERTSLFMIRDTQKVKIWVEQRTVLSGLVLDPQGNRVAGARVITCTYRGADRTEQRENDVITGDSGEFRLVVDKLEGGTEALRMAAAARGFLPAEARVIRSAEFHFQATITLNAGSTLHGRLVDEESKPLVGVPVRIAFIRRLQKGQSTADAWLLSHLGGNVVQWGPKDADYLSELVTTVAVTDKEGAFVGWPPYSAHTVYVIATPADRRPVTKRLLNIDHTSEETVQVGTLVSARPETPVEVFFRYQDGEPAHGVRVLFQSESVSKFAQLNSPWLTTDGRGAVRSPFLEPGETYTVFLRGGPHGVRKNIEALFVQDKRVVTIP